MVPLNIRLIEFLEEAGFFVQPAQGMVAKHHNQAHVLQLLKSLGHRTFVRRSLPSSSCLGHVPVNIVIAGNDVINNGR